MNTTNDIVLYGVILFICFYLPRTLNNKLFKSSVMQTFDTNMKAGFGADIALKLVEQYHGSEGVEIVRKEMQKECLHPELAYDRRLHNQIDQRFSFDPVKLKAILKKNPKLKMGPSKQKPTYCVKCGKQFTDLNDWN